MDYIDEPLGDPFFIEEKTERINNAIVDLINTDKARRMILKIYYGVA